MSTDSTDEEATKGDNRDVFNEFPNGKNRQGRRRDAAIEQRWPTLRRKFQASATEGLMRSQRAKGHVARQEATHQRAVIRKKRLSAELGIGQAHTEHSKGSRFGKKK